MSNVTHEVNLKLSHEAPKLSLARPCLNLWCMPCVHVPNISRNKQLIIYLIINLKINKIYI
jgi:hypothetical protein